MARGSLKRTKAGTYKIVVDVGRDPVTRKRKQHKETFRTKKEAEKKLNDIIRQVETHTYTMPNKKLFGELMETWLNEKKNQVRGNTWRSYQSITKTWIIPQLGDIKLTDLNQGDLSEFYKKLQEEKRSNRTIRHIHFAIRSALDMALKWGLVYKNVAESVTPPRLQKKNFQVWTAEELRRFLSEAKEDKYFIAFFLAATTGMRQSEILGLCWKDVDLKNATLSVTQVLDKQSLTFQEPKTNKSKRSIALDSTTVDVLKKHKKVQAAEKLKADNYNDYGLVVCTPDGSPLLASNLRAPFERSIKFANVPKIRFHDIRHTHATLLLKERHHPKVVQERLGHSSITITIDTYSHVVPGLQEEAASSFSNLIFGPDKKSTK